MPQVTFQELRELLASKDIRVTVDLPAKPRPQRIEVWRVSPLKTMAKRIGHNRVHSPNAPKEN